MSLNKLIRAALMALFVSIWGINSALANTVYHPFVKTPFYHGKNGGQAVPLYLFAKDPLRYMRSEEAYQHLLRHVEEVLGRPIDDDAFRSLITSDDVRLIDCEEDVDTAGITDDGQVGWRKRKCYRNEHLIQARVPGGWVTIASQGCYNPIRGVRPPDPPPAPVDGVCGSNAKRYAYDVTGWPAQGNFCSVGEPSSPSILFPQADRSTLWSCQGQHGGASARCEASREAPPPAPPPPRVEAPQGRWVAQRYIVPQEGRFIHVPGLSVPVCRGQVPIPDTFVNIPSNVMTVTRSVWVPNKPSN